MSEFVPVSVTTADWSSDRDTLLAQARRFLPADLLPDESLAAVSHHYLARVGEEPAGYLCMTPDGNVDSLGTRSDTAEDIASALLRAAVRDAPRHDLSHLVLSADSPWLALAQPLGFAVDQDNTDRARLILPPNRAGSVTGSELVRLEHVDDFRRFSVQLVQQAARTLCIYSEDLEAWLYDRDEFVSAVLALARKSRYSNIRILVRETRPILEHGHRLVRAVHMASEKMQIRKLTSTNEKLPDYLLVDDCGLILRPEHLVVQGIGYTHYRARVKPLLEQFNTLWNSAHLDADLRRMSV